MAVLSTRDRAGSGGGRAGYRPAATVLASCLALWPGPGEAQVFLTQAEALELAFPPPASVERRTAFLEEEPLERARRAAGAGDLESGVVTYYVGRAGEETIGYAYFDAHRVRTLTEVLMMVVEPEGTVRRVEVLRFAEPREYLPPERWLEQFEGRSLGPALTTRGDIVNMTGATLTSRAVTRAVRRILALHEVILEKERT